MADDSGTPRRQEPRSFLPNEIAFDVSTPSRFITKRQLECLAWAQHGKSASDIGGILGLSSRTVEKHLIKVCGHLGVRTRLQAVIRARELGLIGQASV